MKLIITVGFYDGDNYKESSRCTIDVVDDALISEALEEAKKHSAPLVPTPAHQKRIEPHLYLLHSETHEHLHKEKSITDYNLKENDILRLMSGVR